jgi:hypothetical protein
MERAQFHIPAGYDSTVTVLSDDSQGTDFAFRYVVRLTDQVQVLGYDKHFAV